MKLGVYQCSGQGTPNEKLVALEQALAGNALDLVLCPELFMTGYDQHADYPVLAETPEGPFAGRMAALAQAHGTAIAYGYPEADNGAVYNSAALIGADGVLLANHRKRLASPGSFEERAFANGPEVTFADLGQWRLAMVICYEVEFPESIRQAVRGGADLVLVPTALGADWGVVSECVVPARAFENGVWMAYSDQTGEQAGLAFYGGSRVVGPFGDTVVQAGTEETLLVAEIDRDRVEAARTRLPYLRDCVKL